jgi:hypothetical protein
MSMETIVPGGKWERQRNGTAPAADDREELSELADRSDYG